MTELRKCLETYIVLPSALCTYGRNKRPPGFEDFRLPVIESVSKVMLPPERRE